MVDSAPALDTVPVTLLTGFLGSGKTTLLRRVLSAAEFSDTAVVINEIGEISIDHYLVDLVDGDVVELPSGCLCCAVREDLARTLRSLIERRDAGEIRRFRRIVIETSGLADPAPILFTLGTDPMLDQRLRLGRVVTMVDAVTGAATLDRFAEAARQVARAVEEREQGRRRLNATTTTVSVVLAARIASCSPALPGRVAFCCHMTLSARAALTASHSRSAITPMKSPLRTTRAPGMALIELSSMLTARAPVP